MGIRALLLTLTIGMSMGCHSSCRKCITGLSISCTACYAHAHTQYSTASRCYCDSVYFPSPGVNNCIGCHPDCIGCTSPSQTSCNSCPAGSHLAGAAPNTCLCDVGYPNPDAAHCSSCDLSCLTCTGLGAGACASCRSLAVLNGGQCVCKPGYFPNPTVVYCSPCYGGCATCQSNLPTGCLSCPPNSQLLGGSAPSSCVSNPGFFLSPDSTTYQACDTSCSSCLSAGTNWCLGCKPGASLSGPAPAVCLCTPGSFPSPNTANCVLCSSLCLACSVNGTSSCTACKSNAHLSASAPSSCVCNLGFYGSPDASNCTTCDPACSTCTGAGSNLCQSCRPYASLSGSVCVCNGGYYPNPHAGACTACHITCQSCTTGGVTGCGSCRVHASQKPDGSCVCDGGYFMDGGSGYCLPCDVSCSTCSSPAYSSCLSCKTNASIPTGPLGQCVCDTGFYPNPDSGSCSLCSVVCFACMDGAASSCTQCKANAHLAGLSPNTCECDDGFYGSPDACIPCDAECLTCSNGTSSDCLTCKLHASLSGLSPCSCLCDGGYYLDTGSMLCTACDVTCSECVDSTPGGCTVCKLLAGLTASKPATCVCQPGTFPSPDSSNCLACHPSCQTCTSASATACLSCKPNSSLHGTPTVCVCDQGFFGTPDYCQKCHPSCQMCKDGSVDGCSVCKANAYMSGGVPSRCFCETTFYPNPDSFQCDKCSPGCERCDSPTVCLTCSLGFALSPLDNCIQCPQSCVNCDIAMVCSKCIPGTFLNITGSCKECDYYGAVLTANITSPYDHKFLIDFNRPITDVLTENNFKLTTEPVSDFNWTYLPGSEKLINIEGGPWANTTEFVLEIIGTVRDEFGTPLSTRYFSLPPPLYAVELPPPPPPPPNVTVPVNTTEPVVGNYTLRSVTAASSSAVTSSVVVGGASAGGTGLAAQALSKMQYFSYIGETNTNMPQDAGSFYQSLNQKYWMPNFFSKNVNSSGRRLSGLAENKDFLDTAGPFISLLVVIVGVHAALQTIKITAKPGRKWFYTAKREFEWGLYFYLWCFVYLDLLVSALLQLKNIVQTGNNVREIVSLVLAAFVFSVCILTPGLLAWVVATQRASQPHWQFLISSFRPAKWSQYYYPIFFLQRILYAFFIVLFAHNPKVQCILFLIPVLMIAVFVAFAKPLPARCEQLLQLLAECDAVAVFALLCYMTLRDSYPGDFTTWLLIGLTVKSFGCSVLVLLLTVWKSVRGWWADRKRQSRVETCTEVEHTETVENTDGEKGMRPNLYYDVCDKTRVDELHAGATLSVTSS